ncbi:MAG TPA: hypothetical protein VLT45_17480 [Kofleriaceae bacterium]|nr:hypothetical protein [Kofleriaceae bacterium]
MGAQESRSLAFFQVEVADGTVDTRAATPSGDGKSVRSLAPAPDKPDAASCVAFEIKVADAQGREIGTNPSKREARQLIFRVHPEAKPTAEDFGFYRDLEEIRHALDAVYPESDAATESKFRPYFVRVFYLAKLILEGHTHDGKLVAEPGKQEGTKPRLDTATARAEIDRVRTELVDDEASRLKNAHLRELGLWTARFSFIAVLAYVVLRLFATTPNRTVQSLLDRLLVDAHYAAAFMILWVGTFVGVCLSYAIRTPTFTLRDLTQSDEDYLAPQARLLLAGAFATVLALVAVIGLGDVSIGTFAISKLGADPMIAFITGAVCGIGEQKLSSEVGSRVRGVFERDKTAKK